MAAVFKAIGAVASIAAMIPGPHQPIAAGVAAVSTTLAQLTAKKPAVKGQATQFLVGANQKLPYLIGEAYTEGVELYRVGYGGEVNDVQNPYAFIPRVLSCCGPIESMGTSYVNYESTSFTGALGTVQEASGYYNEYLYHDQHVGARPESNSLQAPSGWGTPTNWGASYKLSGFAAVGWSLIWSKKGKRWGGGIPPLGKVPQGVKVYDPRLDTTYSGGSGSHRIDDESTWEYSDNPALHALAYAYGRKVNGEEVFGVRLFDTGAIDLADIVAWANVCDTNSWSVNGTIYEPGDKWNNLKRICEAGAGEPFNSGGVLRFDYQAPRTSLATITKDDLAGPLIATLGKGWKQRHNVLVPRYRSASHQWGYVQADAVEVAAFITADGEEKLDERQWDLVTGVNQVTELATYDLYQRREAGPISFPGKPHMRVYTPGNCLTLHADLGAHPDGEVKVIIRSSTPDPVSGTVAFTAEVESAAKHTAALGLTGGAPTAVTWPTIEDLEETTYENDLPTGYRATLIRNAAIKDPRDASDVARSLLVASEASSVVTISVAKFDLDYPGDDADTTFAVEDITTLNDGTTAIGFSTKYYVYFDYDPIDGGTPTYGLSTTAFDAQNSTTNPLRHSLGSVTTPADGSGGSSGGGGGGGGYGYDPNEEVP